MQPLLRAENIAHSFDYELFDDLSFALFERESVAVIGVSGSGKSTLLHILSTLLRPNAGSVELFGQDIYRVAQKELVALRKDRLGLVFQSHYLFKGFSAYENLEVAAILASQKIDDALLERLGIEHVMEQKVTELSGGQQQRVSIARVLTKKPRIIFADEPTGNLDTRTASEVMALFFEYIEQNNAAMALVTHDERLAFSCDRVYELKEKRLVQRK